LLAHGNARFVVFNQAINSALTSGDGTNWTEHFVQTESYFTDLIFAGDQFFAAAQRLNAGLSSQEFQVLSSPDGVNWTPHPSGFFNLNATLTSTPQTLIAFSAYSQTILQSPWDIRLQDVQRLVDGRAGFRVLRGGGSAESLEIQAASRLSPADWKTIPVTWDLSNSHYAYEAQPGAVSERFYRAVAR
jgi:hypothetical protein